MIRKNKKAIMIAAVVMLIPVIVGGVLWNRLPDTVITHWNLNGEPDGYSGKAFTVFGLNGILYALFALCLFGVSSDPKNENINRKIFNLTIAIFPIVSLFANGVTYCSALGMQPDVPFFGKLLISVVLIVVGNYTPKMRQSYTMGIKLPWTLSSEDNWNRTHRFSGKIWIVCGLIVMLDVFLNFMKPWMYLSLFLLMILIPIVYSYLYFRKSQKKD